MSQEQSHKYNLEIFQVRFDLGVIGKKPLKNIV